MEHTHTPILTELRIITIHIVRAWTRRYRSGERKVNTYLFRSWPGLELAHVPGFEHGTESKGSWERCQRRCQRSP